MTTLKRDALDRALTLTDAAPMDAAALSRGLCEFVTRQVETGIARYFPDLLMPRVFAGHVLRDDSQTIDLAYTLALLHDLGVTTVAGHNTADAIARLLGQIDGEKTKTFWSYRTAEALLRFGPWSENRIVAQMSEAQRANILTAVDATELYVPEEQRLRGAPNNYWAVLARCELARQRLGVLPSEDVLAESLRHVNALIEGNPLGYIDDAPEMVGRFDIYSADFYLFLEPMWKSLNQDRLTSAMRTHAALLGEIALENGAMYAWGRSTGLLSLCMTIEMAAAGVAHGFSEKPARDLGLVRHTLELLDDWFDGGLVAAHRHRSPYQYRGPQRLLQMTYDVLGKIAYASAHLASIDGERDRAADNGAVTAECDRALLFPPRDTFIPFGTNRAGVWMYRDAHWAFQLPLVGGVPVSDYMPWFHAPGVLECPVDSPMHCGIPRVIVGGRVYATATAPAGHRKLPQGLIVEYDRFVAVDGNHAEPNALAGSRTVTFRVVGRSLEVEEVSNTGATHPAARHTGSR